MKKLVIVGAGDFGREVSWVAERINAQTPVWELLGFVDDGAAVQGRVSRSGAGILAGSGHG